MILYNVTIKIEVDSEGAWVAWMRDEHMPDLLKTGLFLSYRLSRLLEQEESDGVTYSAQYACATMDDYNAYIARHADSMREKALMRFAGKFVAFRSVMETVAEASR